MNHEIIYSGHKYIFGNMLYIHELFVKYMLCIPFVGHSLVEQMDFYEIHGCLWGGCIGLLWGVAKFMAYIIGLDDQKPE